MPTINTLTSAEASDMGAELAGLGAGAQTMEGAATRIVRHLYDNLVDDTGQVPGISSLLQNPPI